MRTFVLAGRPARSGDQLDVTSPFDGSIVTVVLSPIGKERVSVCTTPSARVVPTAFVVGLVWLPAVLYLFLTGETGWGVALLVWGAVVVGTVDNILRPRIVSAEARIPDLLILLGTLGGIVMFGAVGIILGPIVIAGLLTVLDIYRRAFMRQLPLHVEPAEPADKAA